MGRGLSSWSRTRSRRIRATSFHADNAGYRAFALLQLHRHAEAEAEARRSLLLSSTERNALLVMAPARDPGRWDDALEHIDHPHRLTPAKYRPGPWREHREAERGAAKVTQGALHRSTSSWWNRCTPPVSRAGE
jgi:hypothetical protein